eukprot:COSAG02_NODE_4254_length_5581_cov_2.070595_3_plen_48_part_00
MQAQSDKKSSKIGLQQGVRADTNEFGVLHVRRQTAQVTCSELLHRLT